MSRSTCTSTCRSSGGCSSAGDCSSAIDGPPPRVWALCRVDLVQGGRCKGCAGSAALDGAQRAQGPALGLSDAGQAGDVEPLVAPIAQEGVAQGPVRGVPDASGAVRAGAGGQV